mmetsp:Transcript_25010/g.60187  ORF Transcript_25010/g.60187 Transcript_25010/m.60187 type:complete len:110 (-) Transcript_25010:49-378(-)
MRANIDSKNYLSFEEQAISAKSPSIIHRTGESTNANPQTLIILLPQILILVFIWEERPLIGSKGSVRRPSLKRLIVVHQGTQRQVSERAATTKPRALPNRNTRPNHLHI